MYPEIPENKKDIQKYLFVYFNTPTRPESDPLPSIFSNNRADPILKIPSRWALLLKNMRLFKIALAQLISYHFET